MSLIRDENGIWRLEKSIKGSNPEYEKALEKYFNCLDPFFEKAKEECEFEFILTLIRMRGIQDAGWDPFENLREIYEAFQEVKRKSDNNAQTHFALFLYGLIIEASEPYEIIANLLNVIEGGRYLIINFRNYKDQNGRFRSQSPLDKISQLKSRAKKLKLDLSFFDEFVDNDLRNAIFHSDYSIYGSELRTSRVYEREEKLKLLNRCIAYYEAITNLYDAHIEEYQETKLIDPHPDFQTHPDEKIRIVVRKGHGVVAIKDNWTKKELAAGRIPYFMGRVGRQEPKLIKNGKCVLPKNPIKKINRFLKKLPLFMRPIVIKIFFKKYLDQ